MRTVLLCALATFVLLGPGNPRLAQQEPSDTSMAEVMKKARRYTEPAEAHRLLQRFLGTWDTATRITMPGHDAAAERGTATFSWLIEGRWLQQQASGTLMGMPIESFSLFGYDNFKQSYVVTAVTSMDTAMNRAEGDLDPRGDVLILYGVIDEYLTGEHDKMVKTVWRLRSDDSMVMEVHDLPIGEHNTKVIETLYTRRK